MMKRSDLLTWIDMEMTGLCINTCQIIEIAAVITDSQLNIIDATPSIAIQTDRKVLEGMNAWCLNMHSKNGLIDRCIASHISLKQAESMVLTLCKKYTFRSSSPLCGNSVHQDRKFLVKYMPSIDRYLNYRIFDVSSFRIAKNLWKVRPDLSFEPAGRHLALEDIKESIEEMRFFKNLWSKDIV